VPLGHHEAMILAAAEFDRMTAQLLLDRRRPAARYRAHGHEGPFLISITRVRRSQVPRP
jgi:hypothetical protein